MLSPWQSCLRFSFKFSCVSGSLNQRANSSSTLLFRRGFNAIAVCFHTLLKKENNQTKCRDKLWRGIQANNCLLHGQLFLLCSSTPPPQSVKKSFYIVTKLSPKGLQTLLWHLKRYLFLVCTFYGDIKTDFSTVTTYRRIKIFAITCSAYSNITSLNWLFVKKQKGPTRIISVVVAFKVNMIQL